MSRGLSHVVRVTFTIVVVAMLVLFARTVDWAQTWSAIRSASPGVLLAAAVVNLLSIVVKGVRWWVFLRAVDSPSLGLALRATFAGAGLNNVLVANGGEAARVIFVARSTHVSSARVLATLALERLFELIGYVLLLVGSLSFLSLPPEIARARPVAIAALVGLVVLLVHLVRRPEREAVEAEAGAGLARRFAAYLQRFMQTVAGLSTGPRFAGVLLLSVVAWGLQVATYALTAKAAGFELSLVGTIAALIAVNLGFAVRATPGNLGVFQLLYAMAAAGFGMDRDQAIGVAFLIQVQQILPVTFIGVLLAPEFIFRRRGIASPGEPPLPGERLPALEPAPPRSE